MELKEFISETISAIADATSELQEKYEHQDIVVNPPSAQSGGEVFKAGSRNYTMRRVQSVQFDVAVSASNEKSGRGRAGIKVLSAEIGGEGGVSSSTENVSRVVFAVPLTLRPSKHEATNIKIGEDQDQRDDAAIGSRSSSDSWKTA